MLARLKQHLRKIMNRYEDYKGPRTLSRIKPTYTDESNYHIVTSDNAEIVIYCKEKIYESKYGLSLFNKQHSVYHVSAICSNEIDERLKEQLKTELTIGPIVHKLTTKEYQRKAIIQAYVDLIIHQFKEDEKAA